MRAIGIPNPAPFRQRASNAIELLEAALKISLLARRQAVTREACACESGEDLENLVDRLARQHSVKTHDLR